MWTYQKSGWWLVAIGAVHCVIGLVLSWDILLAWHEAGWWHSVENAEALHMDRFAALWFQIAGLSWVALGWLMQQWLDRLGSLPPALGWGLLVTGALVAYVLPVSGAWLFLPLGLRLVLAPRTVQIPT